MSKLNWIDPHSHSTFSALDGFGTPEQHMRRVVELGQQAAAISDHGVVTGHFEFQQQALKAGIRPLLGIEFYLADDVNKLGQEKPKGDRREGERKAARYAHITAIAQSQQGYRNLLRLVSLSHDHFFYKPQIDPQLIATYQNGVVWLSGCVIGRPSQLINEENAEMAALWLEYMRDHVEQFYAEIIPCPGLNISQSALPVIWQLAQELQIPTIVSSDAHAPRPEDMLAQDTMLFCNVKKAGQRFDDPDRIRIPGCHYRCSGSEILERCQQVLPNVPEAELLAAMERTTEIAERCVAECPKGTGVRFTVPEGFSASELLKKLAHEGLEGRLKEKCRREKETPLMTCSTVSLSENQKISRIDIHLAHPPDAGAGPGEQLKRGTASLVSTGKPITFTGSCTNDTLERSPKATTSITSAETDGARTLSTSSQCQGERTSCEELVSQPSTPRRVTAQKDIRSLETISTGDQTAIGPAESAGKQSKGSSESRTQTINVSITYEERLCHELGVVCEKGFENYFLIVADLVRELRSQNVLVMPRGSAGGSLLLWSLGVTIVDPIEHDLSFDRFLDVTREDLPDVDIDIQHDRRDEAFAYLEQTYGKEHVAHVATLSRFGARQAILDVAKAHELPSDLVLKMAALVPEGESADTGLHDYGVLTRLFEKSTTAQELLTACPQLAIAAQLEGQVRQFSVHAGGALIDSTPLAEIVAVSTREGKDRTALVDMATAANQGLLKLDLLGSRTLTAIAESAKELGWSPSQVYALPLEDAEALTLLAEGRNTLVFQLQGTAAGRIMRELRPETFDDLVAVSALARPGPIQSGAVKHYVARRRRLEEVPTFHPRLAAILDATLGIVLFQESGMALAALAGYELPDVHKVRKLISKIGGADALGEHLERLATGWFEAGVSVEEIEEVWTQLHRAANYAFPKAHAVQYGYISAWTAYLKAHHPAIYTAASCRNVGNLDPEERIFKNLREFQEEGGHVELLHPCGKPGFSALDDGTIIGGWTSLKGVGPVIAGKLDAQGPWEFWGVFLDDPKVPKTTKTAVKAIGLPQGTLNADAIEHFARWYPLRPLTPEEETVAEQVGAYRIDAARRLSENNYTGDARFVGRITQVVAVDLIAQAKKYGESPPAPGEPTTKCRLTLTDGTGSIDVAFSAKCWRQHEGAGLLDGPGKGLGNTIVVECWWSADYQRWFVRRAGLVRIWQPYAPPPVEKRGKRKASDEDGEEAIALESP